MREVRGGDDKRLYYFFEKFGVKLVGRKGLGFIVDVVIVFIKVERGNRKIILFFVVVKLGIF